ncbi:uncharacterized protein L203_105190 [Cryptococcus depauperatus CBS 7841]|uniref:Uncharacterized protein n=1 Tax=Cryptococcus depauperatus CBS 7841 TaxID=1295531 RepID=A0A1E3HVF3_9TREE|nr:alpha-1,3-mannosyltransferase CMT1 [Cryptococcus depauperatus CBS 7841]
MVRSYKIKLPYTSVLPLPATSRIFSSHRRRHFTISLVVGFLFLISFFSYSDPSSLGFQWPGILPSLDFDYLNDLAVEKDLNSTHEAFQRVCPGGPGPVYLHPKLTPSQKRRYKSLKTRSRGRYMFVTNTRQIEAQLPDLLNTLIVLTRYLSPRHLAISILEGPSSDCTQKAIEEVLLPTLKQLGLKQGFINIETGEPNIDWSQHNRIEKIAELRNRALAPLWQGVGNQPWGKRIEAIVFFNDVYLRAEDVLEVIYQHKYNKAGIMTAIDLWKKRPEYYYDVWVGRTIDNGDLFYPINNPWWSASSDLFQTSPSSLSSYTQLSPFQIFSGWNALVVLAPKPFLPPYNVRFRRSDRSKGECAASECTLIASDFWKIGFGKIGVVPSVQLAYERDTAQDIIEDVGKQKEELGWNDGVPPNHLDTLIRWTDKPPEKVRCHPWPEVNGLGANVWEKTEWVDPWVL